MNSSIKQGGRPTRIHLYSDDADHNAHFWFDGQWIDDGVWATLPAASKSVLPVILSFQHGNGYSFPGELRISSLTGDSPKTVRKGIKHLEGLPNFESERYTTKKGKATRFRHTRQDRDRGIEFPFFSRFFTGGNWFMLKPAGKALYPVLRRLAYFDWDEFVIDMDSDPIGDEEFHKYYHQRRFEFFDGEITTACDLAGISRRSFYSAIESLEDCGFIEMVEDNFIKVFIRPPYSYEPSFMNKEVNRRFGSARDRY